MKMFIAIVLVIMGLTFLVTTNTDPVPLHFFMLTKDVPLPFILIFPVGVVLLFFAFYHLRQMRKAHLIIRELEDSLESEQKKVLEIAKRTHELELENQKLKVRSGDTDFDEDSL